MGAPQGVVLKDFSGQILHGYKECRSEGTVQYYRGYWQIPLANED